MKLNNYYLFCEDIYMYFLISVLSLMLSQSNNFLKQSCTPRRVLNFEIISAQK